MRAIFWLLLIASCTAGKPEKKFVTETSESDQSRGQAITQGKVCATARAPGDLKPSAGRLAIDIEMQGIDPCSIKGYVVGSEQALKQNVDGTFYVENVPPGNQDLIVTAGALSVGLVDNVAGLRVNDIRIDGGQTTSRPSIKLGAVGTLEGIAQLEGQADHVGIRVYVPGTSYQATTDGSGRYRITNIVPGDHDLRFEKLNYASAVIASVLIKPGELVVASPVTLQGQLGTPDKINVAGLQSGYLPTREVKFYIYPSGKPQLMQVSASPFFENTAFESFKTSNTFYFPIDDGLRNGGRAVKTLFVKLQQDAVVTVQSVDVEIDYFRDMQAVTPVAIAGGKSKLVGTLTVPYELNIPRAAATVQVSEFADFTGAVWQDAAKTTQAGALTITRAEAKQKAAVYFRAKTVDDIVSPTFKAEVELELFPGGSINFGLAQSSLDAVYEPIAEVDGITHPLVDAADVELALRADFSDAVRVEGVAKNLAIKDDLCGTHTVHLRVIHQATRIASEVVTKPFKYACYRKLSRFGAVGLAERGAPGVAATKTGLTVWSGLDEGASDVRQVMSGFIYNLRTDQWRQMSANGAITGAAGPYSFGLGGERTLFFGGGTLDNGNFYVSPVKQGGGIYDASRDTWEVVPEVPLPTLKETAFDEERKYSVFGNRFVVYGGLENKIVINGSEESNAYAGQNRGAVYQDGKWTELPQEGAPAERRNKDCLLPILVTSRYILVWGGVLVRDNAANEPTQHGSIFDFSTNKWRDIPVIAQKTATSDPTPAARQCHFMSWTDSKFLVWGGDAADLATIKKGGLLDPESLTWEEIGEGLDVRSTHEHHFSAVEEGKFFLWGGSIAKGPLLWSGVMYDLTKKEWAFIPVSNETPLPPDSRNILHRHKPFQVTKLPGAFYLSGVAPQDYDSRVHVGFFDYRTMKWAQLPAGDDFPDYRRYTPAERVVGPGIVVYGGWDNTPLYDQKGSYIAKIRQDSYLVFMRGQSLVLDDLKTNVKVKPDTAVNVSVSVAPWQLPEADVVLTASLRGPAKLKTARVEIGRLDNAPIEEKTATFALEVNAGAKLGDRIDLTLVAVSRRGARVEKVFEVYVE